LKKNLKKYELSREDLAFALLSPGRRFLDVGCGRGYLLSKAQNFFDELYGVDILRINIKEAIKNAPNAHLKIVDINKGLPFKNSMFDVLVCISVLQFVLDPYFIVTELNRALKRQGILIINVPNIAYIKHRIKLFFGVLPQTSIAPGWDGNTFHYFTLQSLKKLLQEQGFKIEKVSGSGIFAKYRNFYPSLLTGDLMIRAVKH
tara:strand:+ start:954 stop:1562 length:609 start_codon:yes stop_codon:yes gene_type:complete